jgi:hypothetical protein
LSSPSSRSQVSQLSNVYHLAPSHNAVSRSSNLPPASPSSLAIVGNLIEIAAINKAASQILEGAQSKFDAFQLSLLKNGLDLQAQASISGHPQASTITLSELERKIRLSNFRTLDHVYKEFSSFFNYAKFHPRVCNDPSFLQNVLAAEKRFRKFMSKGSAARSEKSEKSLCKKSSKSSKLSELAKANTIPVRATNANPIPLSPQKLDSRKRNAVVLSPAPTNTVENKHSKISPHLLPRPIASPPPSSIPSTKLLPVPISANSPCFIPLDSPSVKPSPVKPKDATSVLREENEQWELSLPEPFKPPPTLLSNKISKDFVSHYAIILPIE